MGLIGAYGGLLGALLLGPIGMFVFGLIGVGVGCRLGAISGGRVDIVSFRVVVISVGVPAGNAGSASAGGTKHLALRAGVWIVACRRRLATRGLRHLFS